MKILVAALIQGVLLGSIYGLAGLTVTVGYRPSRVLNLAQGQFFMIGGLAAARWIPRVHGGLSALGVIEAILLGAAVGGIGGVALRLLVWPVERLASNVEVVVATFGALFVLEGVTGLIWGINPHNIPAFPGSRPISLTSGVGIPGQAFYILGFTAVCLVLVVFLFGDNGLGVKIRAAGYAPTVAAAHGINVTNVVLLGYTLCGVLGGIAGVINVPAMAASFSGGTEIAFFGVMAAVAGGLERPAGPVLAGFLMGLVTSVGSAYAHAGYGQVLALSLLVVVLILRPNGMLAPRHSIALR
ncbi:MAG: putative Inner-rane translocator [Frankiales bacterium]|nr:putative Inner-rane translocator [Frankiales bacterium]